MVFAADHLDLDRQIALKVMVRSEAGNDDAVARFLREARAAARLKSQHVAKVLDAGRLESGVPYIVMELLEGQNLQDFVAEQGPLQVAFAVDLMLEACEALAEAHAAGIVHRDLKPANLFLASDAYGERIVKLLDFGISKMLVGGLNPDLKLTDSHSMMGSPIYMSPEQIRSARTVDHRSDIWSLGVVLFELVTGRVVWESGSLGDVFIQIANDPAPSARSVMPTVPAELDAIIARCMDKNPARRYQHVADLALALAPLGSKRARATLERVLRMSGQGNEHAVTTAVGSRRPSGPGSDVSALPTLLALTDTTEPVHASGLARRRSRKSLPVILASAVGLIVIAAAVLGVARRGVKNATRSSDGVSSGAPSANSIARVNPGAADRLRAPSALAVVATPSAAAPSAKAQTPPAPLTSTKARSRQPSATLPAKTVVSVALGKPAPDSTPVAMPATASRSADPMSVRR